MDNVENILQDFTNLTPGDAVGILQGIGGQLEALSYVLDITDGIPFVDEAISSISDFQRMLNDVTDGLYDAAINALHDVDLSALTGDLTFKISVDGGIAKTINLGALDPSSSLTELVDELNDQLDTAFGVDQLMAEVENGQLVLKAIGEGIKEFNLSDVGAGTTAALGLETSMPSLPLFQFTTLQGLEQVLADSGLLNSVLGAHYDAAANSILFTLDMQKMFDESIFLDFNKTIELPGDIAELVLAGSALGMFSVEAGIDVSAGIDISALKSDTPVGDLNGGIGVHVATGDDISFQFHDGTTATVNLSSLDTDANNLINADDMPGGNPATLQDLIDKIHTDTGNKVLVNFDPARANLVFHDTTAGSNDFIVQAVVAEADNPETASAALIDLGIILFAIGDDDGEISGGPVLDRLFVEEGSQISASAEISASDINLTAALGFLEVGVEGGSLSTTSIDASVALTDPSSDGRIYLDELARKALDGEDLFFESVAQPTFMLTTGMLSLPLVFPDADSFGFDSDFVTGALPEIQIDFFDMVEAGPGGLDVTRLDFNVNFDTAALEDLLTNVQNMSLGQLLDLVVQVGKSIAEDFDLFNYKLPVVDTSINELVQFVNNGIDSIFEGWWSWRADSEPEGQPHWLPRRLARRGRCRRCLRTDAADAGSGAGR